MKAERIFLYYTYHITKNASSRLKGIILDRISDLHIGILSMCEDM